METSLDLLLELAGAHARHVLIDAKCRSLMPAWLLITRKGTPIIVGTPWADDEQKEKVRKRMRIHMAKVGCTAYSFIMEAWVAKATPDEVDLVTLRMTPGHLRPSQRPERKEIVLACAATADEARWRSWRIVREATTERIVDLKLQPFPGSDHEPKSWTAEMLKP